MSNSKYSSYSIDQIMTEDYEQLCNLLLSMAKDEKTREQMSGILYEGGFEDFSVSKDIQIKDNPIIAQKKRAGYAYLLATHPETFEILHKNDISLFHGTNFNALPNILKYGMNSVDKLNEKGIPVLTGEKWSRISGNRSFISFTDDIEIASDYASLSGSKKTPKKEAFGIVLGMSHKDMYTLDRIDIRSELPEIGFLNNVPLEHIKVIGVPEDKVKFVRKLVKDERIIVTPMDIGFDKERFFSIDNHRYDND